MAIAPTITFFKYHSRRKSLRIRHTCGAHCRTWCSRRECSSRGSNPWRTWWCSSRFGLRLALWWLRWIRGCRTGTLDSGALPWRASSAPQQLGIAWTSSSSIQTATSAARLSLFEFAGILVPAQGRFRQRLGSWHHSSTSEEHRLQTA